MGSHNKIYSSLSEQFGSLNITRKNIERLYKNQNISETDIEYLYDSLFVRAVSIFENFIENFFIGLLCNEIGVSTKNKPIILFKNKETARRIISGEKSYLDWLPYDKIKKRVITFFNESEAFTSLKKNDNIIREILYIRNHIAHNSEYSKKTYEKYVINNVPYNEKEKKPSTFLRLKFRDNITRYEFYIYEKLSIAKQMTS